MKPESNSYRSASQKTTMSPDVDNEPGLHGLALARPALRGHDGGSGGAAAAAVPSTEPSSTTTTSSTSPG